jgi:hypothetical protein
MEDRAGRDPRFPDRIFVAGYIIGLLLGGLTSHGFNLTGFPALLLLAAIIAYFVLGKRVFGGTVWKRILGTVR